MSLNVNTETGIITTSGNWAAGDVYTAEAVNNIESAILLLYNSVNQISELVGDSDIASTIQNLLQQKYTSEIEPTINAAIAQAERAQYAAEAAVTAATSAVTSAEEAASAAAAAAQTQINNLITDIYGSSTVDNGTSNSLKEWINAQLSTLQTTVANNIQPSITNLQTIDSRISTVLGSDYDITSSSPLGTNDNISTRLGDLYASVFGTGSAGSTTIQDQINALNAAIFGNDSGSESSLSLIEKIEAAMGRSLDEETNEEYSSDTGYYSNSLKTLIQEIQGVLGIEGGISGGQSNLLETIEEISSAIYGQTTPIQLGDGYNLAKILNDLYGELTEDLVTGEYSRGNNPLINTLKNLPSSIANLSTKVDSLEDDNANIHVDLTEMSSWEDIVDKAYTDADTFVLNETERTYLRLLRKNAEIPTTLQEILDDLENTYILLPEGGGGGTGTGGGTAVITRITDASIQILTGDACEIEYKLEARDSGNDLAGNGTAIWYVGGVQIASTTALNITAADNTITNTFDISPYLSVGTNNIILQISVDTGGTTPTIVRKTWTINVINFSLVWNYNEATIFDGDTVTLEWVPYGANINKTTHIIIDSGTQNEFEITQTTIQSGITQSYTFNHNLSHGVHSCQIYLSAIINGQEETTQPQTHDIIIVRPANITPIISSSPVVSTMEQYDTVAIPIVIYTPNSNYTSNIILAEDGTTVSIWNNIDRTLQYWNYSPTTTGNKILTITVGSVTKTINITVTPIDIQNEEVSGYDFKLKAGEIINNADLQDNELLEFSNNFDWINGGIKTEKDNNNNIQQYICIKAGTTMTIKKKLFNSQLTNGLCFKIIMRTANCSDYDAKILECYANNIGVQLFAHNAILRSSGRAINTQYSENTYIELEFEVYGTNDNPRYMMCWVDGVMTCVRVCDNTDQFEQTNKSDIIIGSTNCDVNIYLIKNYNRKLSIDEHIANFIADAPNATTMKARYNRNNILGEDGEISYEKLYDAAPDCRIWLYDIHRMTTDKKDKVRVYRFDQKWKNGGKEYYDGLYAENAVLTVQGTSSVNYRKGAANTDINFLGSSGTGTPILRSASGEDLLADGLVHKGMKLTDTSIPITYSNMKVNFASCEQVNNMCNAMWYQNFQPYPSLSERDCMEFVMGVQFIKDRGLDEQTVEDPTTHIPMLEIPLFSEKENRDSNKYYMYSIGNLGTSKKNTHIFHSDNECCVEVTDNTTEGQRMIAWPTTLDWTGKVKDMDHSFEFRYPDDPTQSMKDGWERFVRWMAENNPNAATNEPLASPVTFPAYTFRGHERVGTQVLRGTTVSNYAGTYTTDSFNYRMAKMLSECEDYMAMDSVVYHFCYIERHTMVDNVAKNTFWSAAKTTKEINGVDTEGYWIWDLSKNYDNDTSDGNNNEGQLVFDYGNEAGDSIGGKMVFNAADSVWFTFISHLTEACATMFINRESATSNDGQIVGAWNSLSYHNYLLSMQQKIPERVWNECYWYDYLRTYENGINTTWISFLDGGQKIQQRKHYETFQELYLASKYMSPLSIGNMITMRGYTPTITENMTEEQKAIIRATLAAVPSKSEVTVTMYNKCYLTVHMGNNFLQQKVSKGVATTLTFKEQRPNWDENVSYSINDKIKYEEQIWRSKINNNQNNIPSVNSDYWELVSPYLGLNDTVINIDTASMIQEIGDLSPLYPGQSSFGAAYRLRSIKIGSAIEGYQNLNISAIETGAFDFSTNTMLERLEIQNLKSVEAPLNLQGCAALKYLDASGSSFTGYTFADGGLISTAYLGNPNTIIMNNLSYLTDSNLTIDSIANLEYLTINNCPQIDSFNRVLNLNTLLSASLLNVNWRVQGIEFEEFVTHIKTVPTYRVTGHVELTDSMGTFNLGSLGNTFDKDLQFYRYYSESNIQPYYTVSFYDLRGEWLENQYIPSGQYYIDNHEAYFTDAYLESYNKYKDSNWVNGADTRYNFGSWSYDISQPIISETDIYANEITEYRLTYIMHTADPSVFITDVFRYYPPGRTGIVLSTSAVTPFIRDYYRYTGLYWTETNNTTSGPTATQTAVDATYAKKAEVETWYAVYEKNPAVYTVSIYNTNTSGKKQGPPIATLSKKVISGINSETLITPSELTNYKPGIGDTTKAIYVNDSMYASDLAQANETNRLYRFLDWQPYIPNAGLHVTGDMEILAKYYKTDDIFTNYFLNKIFTCTLDDEITKLPAGAFLHNSNLEKIFTKASDIGAGSFGYCIDGNKKQVFVFTSNNVTLRENCFYGANNIIVVFMGTGSIYVYDNVFNNVTNCTIIIPNSNEPIHANSSLWNSFYGFYNPTNILYVTSNAITRYSNNQGSDNIPNGIIQCVGTAYMTDNSPESILREEGIIE